MRGISYKDAVKATNPVTIKVIMHSSQRPEGVSPVRWRIELARRANPKLYDNSFRLAPNPEWLR